LAAVSLFANSFFGTTSVDEVDGVVDI
jgi:hypothetical protein